MSAIDRETINGEGAAAPVERNDQGRLNGTTNRPSSMSLDIQALHTIWSGRVVDEAIAQLQ